ncbi:NADH-quinone oxidoreductase subunit C [Bacillus sp. 1P06AnD]|uniref:NADH-quinone oxidoreductase subunit C n=1 Tax=Bacillus sp. 1P06AnD TaxID=3132208 RepID=UPI0039A22C82
MKETEKHPSYKQTSTSLPPENIEEPNATSPHGTVTEKKGTVRETNINDTPSNESIPTQNSIQSDSEEVQEKAKKIAEAKAKAAMLAKERAAKKKKEEPPEELEPSPNQPVLDTYIRAIHTHIGKESIIQSSINRLSKHVPTIEVHPDYYLQVASFLKNHAETAFDYAAELHATDFGTHFELYVYLCSSVHNHSLVLKVKLDRQQPSIPSVSSLWEGVNWPECEAFDLLGIHFTGHPDLKRIMLGEDWVGHPLRKDYEPYDEEV